MFEESDIPDLTGKVIIVTGGNSGLGEASCLALAKHNPEHIYVLSRNAQKADAAILAMKAVSPNVAISFIECDLSSFASVQKAASEFNSRSNHLNILLCNAGVAFLPPAVTKDGYEVQFGANHMGHALLIKLLLPTLLKTAESPSADVRIVSLSSGSHALGSGEIVFSSLHTPQAELGSFQLYNQSKLANVVYCRALANRYPSIKSVSVHPGLVTTNIQEAMFTQSRVKSTLLWVFFKIVQSFLPVFGVGSKTPAEGAKNQLWACVAPRDKLVNGEYYVPVGVAGKASAASKDEKLVEELWEWTQKELDNYHA